MAGRGRARIGMIGGSGLYDMPGLRSPRDVKVRTPFGAPSGPIRLGRLEGVEVAFLARHGAHHRIPPSAINYRANLYALKTLGVERILSASAVGSLREEIRPGDLVIPDQFIDLTRSRISTFFDSDVVAHVSFADPVCAELAEILARAAEAVSPPALPPASNVHRGGSYVCIEGPQFSTRAESQRYRQWRAYVIGMTNATEAKLAREAEICYSTLALVTDYDCWYTGNVSVTADAVIEILRRNVEKAREAVRRAVQQIPGERKCPCARALDHALVTAPNAIPRAVRVRLKAILGRIV